MDSLSLLRDLFALPPTQHRWDTLCDLLEDTPPEELPEALAHATRLLEPWPDVLREAPGHWLAAAARGEDVPLLQLARTLRANAARRNDRAPGYNDHHNIIPSFFQKLLGDPATWAKLLRNPHLAGLRHIELDSTEQEEAEHAEHHKALLRSRWGSPPPPPAPVPGAPPRRVDALAAAALPSLHTLCIRGAVAPLEPLPPYGLLQRARAFLRLAPPAGWGALFKGSARHVTHWDLDGLEVHDDLLRAMEEASPRLAWRSLRVALNVAWPEKHARFLTLLPTAQLERLDLQPERRGASIPADKAFQALGSLSMPALRRYSLGSANEPLLAPLWRDQLEEAAPGATALGELLERPLPRLRRLALNAPPPPGLLAAHPLLEELKLTNTPLTAELAAEIAALPLLAFDLELPLESPLDLTPLLSSAQRPQRVRLMLDGARRAEQAAQLFRSLAQHPWLSQAQELTLLAQRGFNDSLLLDLLAAPWRATLQRLVLFSGFSSGSANLPITLGALAAAPPPPQLRSLSLSLSEPTTAEIDAFAASPWPQQLDNLHFTAVNLVPGTDLALQARWFAADLPPRLRGLPFAGPWGWTLIDHLRLPPSESLLKTLQYSIKQGLHPDDAATIARRARRWWPEPLRSQLLASLQG